MVNPVKMKPMPGMTLSTLRRHSALSPLFFCLGLGGVMAFGYLARLGLYAHDVGWAKHKNPEFWTKYPPTKQYKFYSPSVDYSKLTRPVDRPDI